MGNISKLNNVPYKINKGPVLGKRPSEQGQVPLERALSKMGQASRAQTREWILAGKLAVNGKIITDPAFRVVPETDQFTVDGKVVKADTACTILFYKPKGIVTTRSDEKGRKTVFDCLPPEFQTLHPVGRLDMNTTGLLLLTNDTQFSARLTDPVNGIERVYILTVQGKVTDHDVKTLTTGIKDGGEIMSAKEVVLRKISNRESHLTVTLIEGKNREIRRMFQVLGHDVITLKRVAFGEWVLGDLQPGAWKVLLSGGRLSPAERLPKN